MPVLIPLAGAAFSVSAGLAAGGVLGGLMVAGGVLSGIGAITGNKKLAGLGSILGLVGGVGNMLAKETASAAAGSVAEKAAAEGAAATAGQTVADAAGTAADVADMAGSAGALASEAAPAAGGVLGQEMTLPAADVAQAAAPAGTSAPMAEWAASDAGKSFAGDVAATAPAAPTDAWGKATAAFDKFGSWTKANPELAKIGGGLIAGAAGSYAQSQMAKDADKRKRSYDDWVRQRYSDSVRNLQIPAPLPTRPASTGIIGTSRG